MTFISTSRLGEFPHGIKGAETLSFFFWIALKINISSYLHYKSIHQHDNRHVAAGEIAG